MNENERAEPAPERAARETQSSLFERLRGLLGLGAGSVRDDIEDALEGADSNADFTPQERAILKNVLALHEVRVADVMVPRADILAVASDTPLSEVLALFRTAGHSRFPVFGETLDDPQGMIHIRDFVDFLASEPKFGLALPNSPSPVRERMAGVEIGMNMPLSAAEILRPVLFAPPSMPALDLLVKMQASRTHMALVIDEYGGTDGLVSIEDVVEAIVGDIEDEHDEAERPQIVPGGDGSFLVEARAPLDEVSEAVGFDFGALADAEDVDTIGGLITSTAGRVPGRGEIVAGPGEFEFEVLDADPRRVKRLKIHPRADPARQLSKRQGRTDEPPASGGSAPAAG
jgi:CBS domain containing-hemolysin-like protein